MKKTILLTTLCMIVGLSKWGSTSASACAWVGDGTVALCNSCDDCNIYVTYGIDWAWRIFADDFHSGGGPTIGVVIPHAKISAADRASMLKDGVVHVKKSFTVSKEKVEKLAAKNSKTKFTIEQKTVQAGEYKITEGPNGDIYLNFGITAARAEVAPKSH